jgi:hypothetical protein
MSFGLGAQAQPAERRGEPGMAGVFVMGAVRLALHHLRDARKLALIEAIERRLRGGFDLSIGIARLQFPFTSNCGHGRFLVWGTLECGRRAYERSLKAFCHLGLDPGSRHFQRAGNAMDYMLHASSLFLWESTHINLSSGDPGSWVEPGMTLKL